MIVKVVHCLDHYQHALHFCHGLIAYRLFLQVKTSARPEPGTGPRQGGYSLAAKKKSLMKSCRWRNPGELRIINA